MNVDRSQHDSPWTPEQRQAIEKRGVSVSLSAGAGCGKTFVLTERFLSDFKPEVADALKPEDLRHLVAITFTERAAREMRDRVRRRCYERLSAATAPMEAEYWAALVRGLDSARISTIHSFCASLLKTHAVEAGIDPNFEVLEQARSETLLSEVVDDELRRLLAEHDPATIELAVRFDLPALGAVLRSLVADGRDDDFERWLRVSPAEQLQSWQEFHREHVLPAIVRSVANSAEARELLALLTEHVSDHPAMQSRREFLLARLSSLVKGPIDPAGCAAELQAIREQAKVQGGGSAKNWNRPEAHEKIKQAFEGFRKLIDGVLPLATLNVAAAAEAAEVGRQLLEIAAGARRRYAERKRELAALDFDDLLLRARALLVDPRHEAMRRRLGAHIRLLLVDEFQDTDRTQVEFVQALCGPEINDGKLFIVGDHKQSIYRFRGADPSVFHELRRAMPADGRLPLTRNFRSQPEILRFANTLFWHDLGPEFEPLQEDRPQSTPAPAIEFLWAAAADPNKKETVGELRRREAEWISRRIRAMLSEGQPLVGQRDGNGEWTARPARPGDIAILFRALSDVELYEAALRRHDVDYYLVGGHAFYAQQEIFDLVHLLRTLASPSDAVSLAGLLRSGFFSLSDETIFWLAGHADGLAAGLFAAAHPAQIAPDQQARVAFAAATIRRLRESKDRLRICELIELAMSLTGYDAALLAEFLGKRKLANLRKVIEQARSFQHGAAFGLTDFIAELSEFVARQPKEPLAATLSEDTDVVRLMTIHQAKGLEFPIVIVPDLDRPSDNRGPRVHLDARLGPLVQLPEENGPRLAGGYELWRFMEEEESINELHRLLYVATTRAADYLLLSAGVQRLGQTKSEWMKLLARRFDLSTGRMIGQLPQKQPRPQIKLTTTAPPEPPSAAAHRAQAELANLERVLAETAQPGPPPANVLRAIEPIPPDTSALAQYSFSRLAGTLHPRFEPAESAGEANGAAGDAEEAAAAIDPRGLGTLVHAVLAEIDFAEPGAWRGLVPLLAERHLPAAAGEVEEASRLIEQFLASPRAAEVAGARDSLAEAEFLLAWPPGQAPPSVILTGYIDRLHQDAAGRWHVLDFKTNRVPRDGVARLAGEYELQMLVYALAAEKILGSPPASVTLHFLRGGAEHQFAWDDKARKRAIALVEEAIAAAAEHGTYASAGGVL